MRFDVVNSLIAWFFDSKESKSNFVMQDLNFWIQTTPDLNIRHSHFNFVTMYESYLNYMKNHNIKHAC